MDTPRRKGSYVEIEGKSRIYWYDNESPPPNVKRRLDENGIVTKERHPVGIHRPMINLKGDICNIMHSCAAADIYRQRVEARQTRKGFIYLDSCPVASRAKHVPAEIMKAGPCKKGVGENGQAIAFRDRNGNWDGTVCDCAKQIIERRRNAHKKRAEEFESDLMKQETKVLDKLSTFVEAWGNNLPQKGEQSAEVAAKLEELERQNQELREMVAKFMESGKAGRK